MSTAMTIQELSQEELAELHGAQQRFQQFSEGMYRMEISIKSQAANQIAKIQLPKTIEQVPAAEAQLTELGKAEKAILAQRSEYTAKLDKLKERLMEPEKSLQPGKKQLTDAIVAIKREYERIQAIKREKEAEVQNIIMQIRQFMAAKDLEYRSNIATKITVALQYALDSDIKPEVVDIYVEKVAGRLGIADFGHNRPDFRLKLVTHEEMEEILNEHYISNPTAYLHIYQNDLRAKFADYEVAYRNKAEAREMAEKEQAEMQARLLQQKQQRDIAATIESKAQPMTPEVSIPSKALKKAYELDMEENEVNASVIATQYWVNIGLTRHKTRASWFKLTIAQMGAALAAVKNDDNSFEVSGVKFKEVSRL